MSEAVRGARTPQEAAERLANSLDDNTDALNGVRRRYRLTLALIVAVALTVVVAVKFNHDGNISRCESGNELREEIDNKWDAISTYLSDDLGVGDTPNEQVFLDLLSQDFDKQDCSDTKWFGQ